MDYLDLAPVMRVGGRVCLPGSKSISNRTLLLAALAEGDTQIEALLDSEDTRVMLAALQRLGVACSHAPHLRRATIRGTGGRFPVAQADLFLGNAGTAFRPLTAALALAGGDYRLSGVPRMHERPIGDLVDALRQVGARIDYGGRDGFPPLHITPGRIALPPVVRVRGDVSSQFLTALLLALPLAGDAVRIEVSGELISKPYVDMTLNMLARFGIAIEREGWSAFVIPRASRYLSPGRVFVEGDASSASYFLAAGAIGGVAGGDAVRVEGIGRGSIQGDVRFVEVLERMGAAVSVGENWIEAGTAGRRARSPLRPIDADLNHIPDSAMTAAILALFAPGTSVLRNIGSWRVKETDRIAAMAAELAKVGARVEALPDALRITAPAALSPATISTYDDHRMAMCFSLVALGGVPVRIENPNCVAKTFPEYFSVFASVCRP
ncbi:MAG: 3-phosphoshikimate 1-carboxyvinyltransferase [Burkholderiales bacterium]|nr:3-phosphoshikimate 1-carboxyvinyltransferase [Burkholderiales bacterium]